MAIAEMNNSVLPQGQLFLILKANLLEYSQTIFVFDRIGISNIYLSQEILFDRIKQHSLFSTNNSAKQYFGQKQIV